MTIDGQLSGWPGRPPERIAPDRLTVGSDSKGVEASFKVCWDEDALYLWAHVTDPTPMRNARSGADLGAGDGLELFLGWEAIDEGGPLRFTDRQILIGAGKSNGKGQVHVVNAPRQPDAEQAVTPAPAGNGYTIEIAIPWSVVGVAPKEGLELLFDLAVDDSSDGTSRTSQLMWNGTARNSADRGDGGVSGWRDRACGQTGLLLVSRQYRASQGVPTHVETGWSAPTGAFNQPECFDAVRFRPYYFDSKSKLQVLLPDSTVAVRVDSSLYFAGIVPV